jgi:ABC-type lipoprotein export system ATPase subunit
MILIENARLAFGDRNIIDNFNLKVGKGEKVVLKGPSGTGKTTILSLVMGFTRPDSGRIFVTNKEVNSRNISAVRKNFAWLPQNFNVIRAGDVRASILAPFAFAENRKNTPAESEIIGSLEMLGLDKSILDNSIDNVSGGEKQRICLVICKLLKKPVMLADEPTSALDRESKLRVIDFILNDKDLTVLSSSHDEEWVGRCGKVIEL